MLINSILLTVNPLIGYILSNEKSQSTLPIALFQLAGMFAVFPASLVMRCYGRRGGFIIGVLIGILGSALGIYGIYLEDFWVFAASTFVIGIYNGFANFYVFAAADVVSEFYRSKVISFVIAGGMLASLAGPLLIIFIQKFAESRLFIGPFASILIFQLFSLFLLLFLNIPDVLIQKKQKIRSPIVRLIQNPTFMISILGGMCGNGLMILVMTASPLAMSAHHHSIDDTAFSMQIHLLGMFIPSLFTGYLIAKFNAIRMMIVGATIIFIGLVINTTELSFFNVSCSLFFLGIGWNFMNVSSLTLLTKVSTAENQAMIQALYEFSILSVMAFFVYISGVLMNQYGWIPLNILCLLVLLILFLGMALNLQRSHITPVL